MSTYAALSWATAPPPVPGPAVPTEPFSSRSEALIHREQSGEPDKYPYHILLPQGVGPRALRFATFVSYHSCGEVVKRTSPELEGIGVNDGYRWPLLLGTDPGTETSRYFIGAPLLRKNAYNTMMAYDMPSMVFDWRTVRNCFTRVAPTQPWIMHTVLVELSERLWSLYWGPVEEPIAHRELHDLTECLTRLCSGQRNDSAIYDAEEVLKRRAEILRWAVGV